MSPSENEPISKAPGENESSPHAIRFSEVEALLRRKGFVLFNQRGSHCTFHHESGALLTIVKPHGSRKTGYAWDIERILELLNEHEDNT